jgi:hypothetical protein
METTIVDGVAFIGVEFEAWADAEDKYDEVTREVNAAADAAAGHRAAGSGAASVPARQRRAAGAGVGRRALQRARGSRARSGHAQDRDRRAHRRKLGISPRELRVAVDLTRLARFRVTPGQLVQALQSENANIPAGVVDIGQRSFSLRTSGAYASLDQVRNTVIGGAAGRGVRVRDVAEVSWNHGTLSYVGRYNGKRAVFVTASQKDGFNSIRVQRTIDAALDRYEGGLPPRIRLERGFEQARNVSHRLDRLYADFGIAIALVALTLLPLGWRAAGIVMVSIRCRSPSASRCCTSSAIRSTSCRSPASSSRSDCWSTIPSSSSRTSPATCARAGRGWQPRCPARVRSSWRSSAARRR